MGWRGSIAPGSCELLAGSGPASGPDKPEEGLAPKQAPHRLQATAWAAPAKSPREKD